MESNYLLAQYEPSGKGILSVQLFALEAVKIPIETGKLEGEVVKGENIDQVTVTAGSEALAKVMVQEGYEAFTGNAGILPFQKLKKD